ncbi:hypothetical protein EMIHUDRAFT_442888 [Emiliania huxleyi CCMP1516]|uniref:PARP-type domain-containing protein n=4 Tax=Emiliania huxleyi TaxID=2903 RepID=A0A0D3JZ78_EMIH1|nr:hypothetical protein EMIHUDRAFT_442888 [Emiliania huxleyi CCMP1516]EOD28813.1 hypothetical protein EMIHUDRAFT_442888 [Emiliania huxleyi CCMP1516]|eukprot:XP_005781242.1 hypothetical protein EMIHUDRAFT_442888 [Emiliania huxleyi CCMP1516]
MLPSETRRRIALADAKKPTAQHAGNQGLVDVFWVLADATFKAEPENAGTKGSAYRKAAQAFAACAFAVTAETVSISGEKKLANVGKASFEKMAAFRATGSIPKLVAYQATLDGADSSTTPTAQVASAPPAAQPTAPPARPTESAASAAQPAAPAGQRGAGSAPPTVPLAPGATRVWLGTAPARGRRPPTIADMCRFCVARRRLCAYCDQHNANEREGRIVHAIPLGGLGCGVCGECEDCRAASVVPGERAVYVSPLLLKGRGGGSDLPHHPRCFAEHMMVDYSPRGPAEGSLRLVAISLKHNGEVQQAACVPLLEARTFLASLWAACAADGRPLLGEEGPWREDGPLAASLFGDRAIVAPAQRAWAIDALEGAAAPASPPPAAGRGWAKRDWTRFVAEERDGPLSPAGRHGQMKRAASRDLFPKYYPIHCPGGACGSGRGATAARADRGLRQPTLSFSVMS